MSEQSSTQAIPPMDRCGDGGAPASNAQEGGRRHELDVVKGAAIALVVFGHVIAGAQALDVPWYTFLKGWVNQFHVALFFFVSGFMVFLSEQKRGGLEPWPFILGKLRRFAPGFVFMAALVFLCKIAFSQAGFHVENVPHLSEALDVFISPRESYARFLWFVYVLTGLYVLFGLCLCLPRGRMVLLAVSILLACFPFKSRMFCLHSFSLYTICFTAGYFASRHEDQYRKLLNNRALVAVLGVLFLASSLYFRSHLFSGLLSIVPFHYLALQARCLRGGWICALGRYSLSIYYLNILNIGVVQAVMMEVSPLTERNFIFYFPILYCSGIILSLVLKLHVINRIPVLRDVL